MVMAQLRCLIALGVEGFAVEPDEDADADSDNEC